MKRPKLAAASVKQSRRHENGAVDLQVLDPNGNTMEITLSPLAADQALEALLSNPPLSAEMKNPKHFVVKGLSRHKLADGSYGFALHLRVGQAIRIAIDPLLAEKLAELVQTFGDDSTWTGPTTH